MFVFSFHFRTKFAEGKCGMLNSNLATCKKLAYHGRHRRRERIGIKFGRIYCFPCRNYRNKMFACNFKGFTKICNLSAFNFHVFGPKHWLREVYTLKLNYILYTVIALCSFGNANSYSAKNLQCLYLLSNKSLRELLVIRMQKSNLIRDRPVPNSEWSTFVMVSCLFKNVTARNCYYFRVKSPNFKLRLLTEVEHVEALVKPWLTADKSWQARVCMRVFSTLMSWSNENKSWWELTSESLYESFLNSITSHILVKREQELHESWWEFSSVRV